MSLLAVRRIALFGCATLVAGLALAPVAAQQAAVTLTHDAVFDVGGMIYSGGTTFTIDKAGAVTGTMKLDLPAIVDAKLNGTVQDGVWTFNYPFTMNNEGQPCSGTLSGTAQVKSDGSEAAGPVTVSGDCSPEALAGTFTFKKRAK